MKLYTLDPMLDSRWDEFAEYHPKASVFHQKGWLEALARTYGYRPLVLTSAVPGKRLTDGIVFCEVKSWITGRRLVSLPFADHVEPLMDENFDFSVLGEWVREACKQHSWKYIELRPLCAEVSSNGPLVAGESFWLHTLDLAPSLGQIFRDLHKNCIQRRIRRAEREQLTYEKGCSERLLDDFYRLVMITRRRHSLLPQPRAWFKNLIACMGTNVEIRLVRQGAIPVAAILTLRHRHDVVYKYGCSDERLHNLGGMPLLFWRLIEESKAAGAEQIDFGRTDLDNDGLIEFKDRFGTTRKRLTYFRYPKISSARGVVSTYLPATGRLFSILPDVLSSRAGRMVYRHIG